MSPESEGGLHPHGSSPPLSVVIHAHFYQPPREEPWLEEIPREPTAAPFHDWNERIERECYRTVVAARIPAPDGRIARVVNTLERISFNVGPTLADWLERHAPETWRAIVAADRASAARCGGHGNALAMPYHHVILPLANRRDKETEVRWGIADFRRRYGREPEGMWLPETAVDDESLDVLAAEGIGFTILAPHQVTGVPPLGLPGRYRTASGRTIALIPYDGGLSHDIAFGPLIRDGSAWAKRILSAHPRAHEPHLVSMATDGETFGHHHRFGEMALAAVLERLRSSRRVRLESPAAFLERHPPAHDVGLVQPSSWSCPHGVERWRSDCGCRTKPEMTQAWRAPLREALDWLASELHARFEREGAQFVDDPWAARDAWIERGNPSESSRLGELLEMERNALRMFTSCGWFFDDVGGLETVICLRYAARAIELAGPGARELEDELRRRLAGAPSNDPAVGTGREVYDARARPRYPGQARAAAGYAAVRPDGAKRLEIGPYIVESLDDGRVGVVHRRTGTTWSGRATVESAGEPALRVAVELEGESPVTVPLGDLPAREREAVRGAVRRRLRQGVLTPGDEKSILEGEVSYSQAIAAAVLRLLPAHAREAAAVDVPAIGRALDLLELEGQHIPFDAQTRCWRLLTEGKPEVRRALGPLARRFGFAATR
ncbi:MAG: DUF3536 domain-containing protein [Gemmatimonadales bacterium]